MRQLIKSSIFLLPAIFFFYAGHAQKTIAHDDEWPKLTTKPDLSIVSVNVVYPTTAQAPTLTTPRGTVQGNPNSTAANPITQCDGAIHILLGHLEPGKPVTTSFTYTTPPTGGALRNEVMVSVKGAKPEGNTSNNSRSAGLHL